jgi:glyoxylase-like metal-dependent hydrolase (beta-lactamase superfamily II)
MNLYKIETGNLKLDGGAMFGVVPKSIWNKIYPSDDSNLCNWAMRCLLIETEGRRVLIDTGMGNKQEEKFFSHYFPNGNGSLISSLHEHGFSETDITDVLLTHLHFDHVGGAVTYDTNRNPVPTFPNAVYHISRSHWELATNPNRREKASFLPENFMALKEFGQLNLIENEGEHLPNIEFRIFDGHTIGQIIPHIRYKNRTLVYGGDLFPSTAHIPMPYIMSYDTQPLLTLNDKKRFFEHAITNDYVLYFEHDLYNECCSLIQSEKGVKVGKSFTLKEFIEM